MEKKKEIEWNAVKVFLLNNKIELDEDLIDFYPEEPADIGYRDEKFQVVSADFNFQKLIHTAPKDKCGAQIIERPARNLQDAWRDFIVNPILKKNKYGESARGIILLIDSYTEPPWIEKQLNVAKKLSSNLSRLRDLGFDEIYLVCPSKNIKAYP